MSLQTNQTAKINILKRLAKSYEELEQLPMVYVQKEFHTENKTTRLGNPSGNEKLQMELILTGLPTMTLGETTDLFLHINEYFKSLLRQKKAAITVGITADEESLKQYL